MEITSYNFNPQFRANINSPKLKFKQSDFFVQINGYGKNYAWAKEVKQTADTAVKLIRENAAVENILKLISTGIICANRFTQDISKRMHTGILRIERNGWMHGSDWDGCHLITDFKNIKRYQSYQERLDRVALKPLKNPYKNIKLTTPIINKNEHYLRHGDAKCVNDALRQIFEIYNRFKMAFNSKDINDSQLKEVHSHIAEIRWIMAHATPWERGSDAISNVFMRAMYKSLGIKTYPLKKGVSLDMEAYCTELKDYKKNFPKYFEKEPKIIE